MDPNSDVRSDVDYEAVLSHMTIHKGNIKSISFFFFCQNYYWFQHLDNILHNNESATDESSSAIQGQSSHEIPQEGKPMGLSENKRINFHREFRRIFLSFRFSNGRQKCSKKFSCFFLFE